MGSFIARRYISDYGDELAAAVISGTAGPESPTELGKMLARIIIVLKGERQRSKLLKKISMGSYNKKFKDEKSEQAWLTRDRDIQERYATDPLCGYTFTARGYHDLFDLLGAVSSEEWADSVPKGLPILIISGDMDPVGNYGKGVRKVYDALAKAKVKDVTLRLYNGGRHELFNEINRADVISDTLDWLDSHIYNDTEKRKNR
jgi:alpha-beta hydrolase superfamily lysophospholipase